MFNYPQYIVITLVLIIAQGGALLSQKIGAFNKSVHQLIEQDKSQLNEMRDNIVRNESIVSMEFMMIPNELLSIAAIKDLNKFITEKGNLNQKDEQELAYIQQRYQNNLDKVSRQIICLKKSLSLLKEEKRKTQISLKKMNTLMEEGILWVSEEDTRRLKKWQDERVAQTKRLNLIPLCDTEWSGMP